MAPPAIAALPDMARCPHHGDARSLIEVARRVVDGGRVRERAISSIASCSRSRRARASRYRARARSRRHRNQHRNAQPAPNPFAGAERALQRREHAARRSAARPRATSPHPRRRRAATRTCRHSAPCSAAPVSTRPRIGPAHGAHSNPVPMPSSTDENGEAPRRPVRRSRRARAPSATNGRINAVCETAATAA